MTKNQLWASLVEKALVKVHGVYDDLDGGVGEKLFLLLTGYASRQFYHVQYSADEIYTRLTDADRNKFPMVTATSSNPDDVVCSLLASHEYTIIRLLNVNTNIDTERLIQIRNPAGKLPWTGKWGPKSVAWDNVDEATLPTNERGSESTGVFWMCITDYTKWFDETAFCMIREKWYRQNVVGYLYSIARPTISCIKITILEPTQLEIHGAIQEKKRELQVSWDKASIICMDANFSLIALEGGIPICRAVMQITLEPGDYHFYLVSERLAEMGEPMQFNFMCHSDKDIWMEEVIKTSDWMAVAFMQASVGYGKQTEGEEYTLFEIDRSRFSMDLLMVRNDSLTDKLLVQAQHRLGRPEGDDDEYIQYLTRGEHTTDVIPPNCSMIINITGATHCNLSEGAPRPSQFKVDSCYHIDDDNFPVHQPELSPTLRNLHRFVINDELKMALE